MFVTLSLYAGEGLLCVFGAVHNQLLYRKVTQQPHIENTGWFTTKKLFSDNFHSKIKLVGKVHSFGD